MSITPLVLKITLIIMDLLKEVHLNFKISNSFYRPNKTNCKIKRLPKLK